MVSVLSSKTSKLASKQGYLLCVNNVKAGVVLDTFWLATICDHRQIKTY